MNWRLSMVLGVILGVLATIAITALVICIGSAVNGVTFSQQICDWFGKVPVKDVAGAVASSIARVKI